MAKPLEITPEELKKQYIGQNMTIMDLALKYKVHYGTIIKYLRRYGLKKNRRKQERLSTYFQEEPAEAGEAR